MESSMTGKRVIITCNDYCCNERGTIVSVSYAYGRRYTVELDNGGEAYVNAEEFELLEE